MQVLIIWTMIQSTRTHRIKINSFFFHSCVIKNEKSTTETKKNMNFRWSCSFCNQLNLQLMLTSKRKSVYKKAKDDYKFSCSTICPKDIFRARFRFSLLSLLMIYQDTHNSILKFNQKPKKKKSSKANFKRNHWH